MCLFCHFVGSESCNGSKVGSLNELAFITRCNCDRSISSRSLGSRRSLDTVYCCVILGNAFNGNNTVLFLIVNVNVSTVNLRRCFVKSLNCGNNLCISTSSFDCNLTVNIRLDSSRSLSTVHERFLSTCESSVNWSGCLCAFRVINTYCTSNDSDVLYIGRNLNVLVVHSSINRSIDVVITFSRNCKVRRLGIDILLYIGSINKTCDNMTFGIRSLCHFLDFYIKCRSRSIVGDFQVILTINTNEDVIDVDEFLHVNLLFLESAVCLLEEQRD